MTTNQIISNFPDFEQLLYILEFCNDPTLSPIQNLSYEEVTDLYNNIHIN